MIRTLPNQLIRHVRNTPESLAVALVTREDQITHLTYRDFYLQAHTVANALKQIGIKQDDLVLIVLKHSSLLLSSFWGALLVCSIPSVFPYLTEKLDRDIYIERMKLLVEHEQIKTVITFDEFSQQLTETLSPLGCQILCASDIASTPQAIPQNQNTRKPVMKIQ